MVFVNSFNQFCTYLTHKEQIIRSSKPSTALDSLFNCRAINKRKKRKKILTGVSKLLSCQKLMLFLWVFFTFVLTVIFISLFRVSYSLITSLSTPSASLFFPKSSNLSPNRIKLDKVSFEKKLFIRHLDNSPFQEQTSNL
jgi:hypothetical protein